MDNLNFIKIYFKEFIYKIIVPKKYELSRKEIKKKKSQTEDENTSTYKDQIKKPQKESPKPQKESQFGTLKLPN